MKKSRTGLHRVVKTIKGKKGATRRSYWVKSGIPNHLYARKAKLGFVGGVAGGISAYAGGAIGHRKDHMYAGAAIGSVVGSTAARLTYMSRNPRINRGYKTADYSTKYHADLADRAGSIVGHAVGFGAAALAHHAAHRVSVRWTHGSER